MGTEEGNVPLIRQLAHELRDALSPLSAAVDLARLRGFDAEASRLLAEKVERGLRRTRAILDALVPAADSARAEAQSPPRAAGGNRILIVDDSLDVRRSYRAALDALRYTVLEAADAEQALSALDSEPPDIALIDIHLPQMSGFRLAQTIRERAGASIYLVMLSGMALDAATRSLAREAGFDECLDKMAGPMALRELIVSAGTRRS
jgi:CheY-like chemotaxis protein